MAMPGAELGAIRPHGLLLAVEERDLAVAITSANTWQVLGLPTERVLGATLSTLLATPTEKQVRELLANDAFEDLNPITAVSTSGAQFDAIVHRTDGLLVLELEPASTRI